MTVVLVTLVVFLVVVGIMALGVMVHGRSLKGSCGGPGSSDCHCTTAREAQSCDSRPH